MEQLNIAFIGGGNMSSCIFNGIIATRGNVDNIIVSGPHVEKLEHFANKGATVTADNLQALRESKIIFLGVKPQIMPDVLEEIKNSGVDYSDKLFISMAAGFKFSAFFSRLGAVRLLSLIHI